MLRMSHHRGVELTLAWISSESADFDDYSIVISAPLPNRSLCVSMSKVNRFLTRTRVDAPTNSLARRKFESLKNVTAYKSRRKASRSTQLKALAFAHQHVELEE